MTDGADEAESPEGRRIDDENGVDLTLIRARLELSPTERLHSLQNTVRAIQQFRAAAPSKAE